MTNKVVTLFAVIATAFVLVSCDMAPMPTGCWYVQNALDEDITITKEQSNALGDISEHSFVLHPYDIHTIASSMAVYYNKDGEILSEIIDPFISRTNKVIITYKGVDYVETSSEGKSIINLGSYVFFPVNDNTGDQKFLFVIDEEYLNSLTVEDSEE
ncbi:MAG: hypothetical protein MJZ98_03185 [Paludibacteraceae bacterium]|nr:hypothetical protein [Paludibacteraceae bacterium]